MKQYKGILLDIDNTLYEYKPVHAYAINAVVAYLFAQYGIDEKTLHTTYFIARTQVQREVCETAGARSRMLYFQRMLELLEIKPFKDCDTLHELYWNAFYERMKLSPDAHAFLEAIKGHVKICLLTDLSASIQFKKIAHLGLAPYADAMVTSEETGHEKPHPYMFMKALLKIGMKPHEVCMIGDNFVRDIEGAAHMGIRAFWLNRVGDSVPEGTYKAHLVTSVENFKEIGELFGE